MNQVLEELRRVRKCADADAVHELRVAIRRCRSVATVMLEVDGHPTWTAMKELPRSLFRALGALRDLQVLEAWIRQLAAPDDPLGGKLLTVMEDRQTGPRSDLRRALRKFDRQGWQRLARRATRRASVVMPNSLTAQCLALERFEEFRRLHEHAVQTEAPAPWHELRIGLKRFRYAVEILLPERSAEWDHDLGALQDVLGEVHDLDVLRSRITQESDGTDPTTAESLGLNIAHKRRRCIEQYRRLTRGEGNVLRTWRAGLPDGKTIGASTAARFCTTARAMDPHPRRTIEILRLAMRLFDRLAVSGTDCLFREHALSDVLLAAAQLHGIDTGNAQRARPKAARDFLRNTALPLGWTLEDWQLVAHVVRYQRGAEPSPGHRAFAQLSPRQQDRVRGLAGVLRLARGLHRCDVRVAGAVQVDATSTSVRIRVAGIEDAEENAARLARAKHLLERYLRKPVLIGGVTATTPIHELRLMHRSPGHRLPAVAAAGGLVHAHQRDQRRAL